MPNTKPQTNAAREAGHTPGPWSLQHDALYRRGFLVRDKGGQGYVVAACDSIANTGAKYVNESLEANARLIAAAPELLTALIKIERGVRLWMTEGVSEADMTDARAAIAKAKGAQ